MLVAGSIDNPILNAPYDAPVLHFVPTPYSTVSVPFPKLETGTITVKVINDDGAEVAQVFEVK
jgi:P pilus assembly chaperone PapD